MPDDGGAVKSFIEHLRTIHFALIVAATALWIALLASFEPRLTRKALDDCSRIQHLTTELEWESWWAAYAGDQWTVKESSPFRGAVRYVLFDTPEYKRYWKIQFPSAVWAVKRLAPGAPTVPSITWNGIGLEIESPPRTLDAFRQFWNRAIQPHVVIKPRRAEFVTVLAELVDGKEDPIKTKLPLLDRIDVPPDNSSEGRVIIMGDPRVNSEPTSLPTYSLNLVESTVDGMPRLEYALAATRGLPADFPHETRNMRIAAPAVMDQYPSRTPAAWLCERYYRDWTPQQFDRAFFELLSVAPKNVGNLPLTELEDHVRASIRLTNGDVEIAGLRVPSEALTWFAPLIIVSLQLYLLLHAKVLSEIPTSAGARPLVAWVGLFNSIVSRGVFVASGVVLPATVLTFAVIRAVLLQLNALDVTLQVAGATVVYIQGVMLVITMRTIWAKQAAAMTSAQSPG